MISLEKIEAMEPDQASLDAARKLLDSKNWPVCGIANDSSFIWGVSLKYIGQKRLMKTAVATLATNLALLLLGVPVTAKS